MERRTLSLVGRLNIVAGFTEAVETGVRDRVRDEYFHIRAGERPLVNPFFRDTVGKGCHQERRV